MDRELTEILASVPDTFQPTYDGRCGGYNIGGYGLRCRVCTSRLTSAHLDADGWHADHADGLTHDHAAAPLPTPFVGKTSTGKWSLTDQWGSVWAFGFRTRDDAARFAYWLMTRRGNVPLDWITATS